ncbi:unnamed protein product [Paramecium sonneborni]|uniref:Uncharacterized protein n=1 Tax=Paramecium sonneborni TaxID=65129 RepID=A0A8S1RQ25_9CILI|nr:unnamed protein product [Paramecium sonneborni]
MCINIKDMCFEINYLKLLRIREPVKCIQSIESNNVMWSEFLSMCQCRII